jgi:hypothetical protein
MPTYGPHGPVPQAKGFRVLSITQRLTLHPTKPSTSSWEPQAEQLEHVSSPKPAGGSACLVYLNTPPTQSQHLRPLGREVELRKYRAWQVSLPQQLAQPE